MRSRANMLDVQLDAPLRIDGDGHRPAQDAFRALAADVRARHVRVAWSLNFILLGSTGRISVIAGPINHEIGAMQHIHPYRRANITDAVVSTFSDFVPWQAHHYAVRDRTARGNV